MYRYKRLLVGLTGAARDCGTIQYAAMVSRMAKSEKIYFVHVATSLDIPEPIRKAYPELLEPVDEHLAGQMREMVEERFSGHPEIKVDFEVVVGTPLVEILRLVRQKEIDLILVGKTREHHQSGLLPEKLARKAPCSILIIPEGAQPRISKILVPVDFSEHSVDAMDVGIAFRTTGPLSDIVCAYVHRDFAGQQGVEATYEQLAETMRESVEKTYRAFIQGFGLKGSSVTPIFLLSSNPSRAIAEAIEHQQADLVVVGARGRTAVAALVLGSVTERLIASTKIPLIAVKKKGTGLSLLDALFPL
jgi:nucleotide-binding universal stress UspA family protein